MVYLQGKDVTCLAPMTMGMRHSGSVAWVDSSIRHCLNRKLDNQPPAPPGHRGHGDGYFSNREKYVAGGHSGGGTFLLGGKVVV